jgi:TP901 family phage tail tape measure protein
MADQLRLDIQVTGGPAAQQQLAALEAQVRAFPAAAQGATQGATQLGGAVTTLGQSAATSAGHATTLQRSMVSLGTSLSPLPSQFNEVARAGLSLGGITPAVAGLTLGVGLLAAGAGVAVNAAVQFGNEMGKLRAILPVSEVAQFGGALADLAQRLGRDTVFSSSEAIEAMSNLARSGVSAQNILGGVAKATLDMAAAMGGSPKEAALTLGAAMREFNLPASEATHVANQFAAAVHVAGLSAEEMRSGVSRVAPVANALGASLDDVISGMELLARSGMEAGRAGTTLAQIYEDVVNPRNKQAAALMQQLGFTTDGGAHSFLTATGTVKPFVEVIKVLGEGLKDLTPAQEAAATQTEFSRRAMQGALAAVNAYKNGGLDQLVEAQHNARDAASAMAERMDNLGGDLQKLQSSSQTLAVQLGNDLTPALRGVAKEALDATNKLIDLHKRWVDWDTRGQASANAATGGPTALGPIQTSAGANVAQLFPADSMLQQIQDTVQHQFAPGIADSLENGLRAQRIGERVAGTLSHEVYRAGVDAAAAFAQGLTDNTNVVVDASARIASEAGAALQANKGNSEAAIRDLMGKESGSALDQGTAQILQRTEALKAVTGILGTLAPAERAHYEAELLANGADDKATQSLTVLNDMLARGTITQEQRTAALTGGALAQRTLTEAQARATEAALGGAVAVRDHADALAREHEAALGGALAIRDHEEALAREKEQALGGAVAIRAHSEDLAREKEQALGGALAIRSHSEDLAREKEAALGGAVAIRDHEEALAREKEAALGGALAIREHSEQLQREHEAALGGVAAIRDHEDALNREKTAALGGEVGIRAHAEALNEEKIAALGGRAAILDHQAALQQLDAEAQQSRTVFVDLADKMANYAKSTNEAAVAQSIGYANANQATSAALKELTGAQQAEVKALQNAGDAYGALTTALEQAGVGYQDIAGLINGEREATERLNESIQRNTQYRAAQRTAIQQANETQFRAAITATGQGGGLPQYLPAGGGGGEQLPQVQGLNEWMNRFPGMFQQAVDQVLARQGSGTTQDVFAQLNTMFGQWTTQNNAVIASDQARAKATDADTHATQAHSGAVVRATQDAHQNLDNLVDAMGPLPGVTNEFGQRVLQSAGEMQNFYARWRDLSRASALQSDVLGRLNDDLALTARTTSAGGDQVAAAAARAALQISDLAANTGQSVAEVQRLAQAAGAAAAATWQIAQAVGAALQAGQMRNAGVAGGVTEKGLTYGQIAGNTGTTSGGGGLGNAATVQPGNLYGIPIVSPLTPGTLRGYATGGPIDRPTLLVDQASMRPYARAGEAGPEWVGPRGGGGGVALSVNVTVNGADALRDTRLWEQLADRQIVPVLRKRGLVA